MPTRTSLIPLAIVLGSISGFGRVLAQDRNPPSPSQYEDRLISQLANRAVEVTHTEIHRLRDDLSAAYPGKIGEGVERKDVAKWFDVLAGGEKEWRRADAPNEQIERLFDRVAERAGLGPVPTLRRTEYEQYSRNLRTFEPPDKRTYAQSAERAFRVLDRDASGTLESAEWPGALKSLVKQVDDDNNRRIDAKEYLAYFETRVTTETEAMAKLRAEFAKLGGFGGRKPAAGGLPAWFKKYDTDMDGQIGLYEWREAGQPIEEFLSMDLNADGLLPPSEFERYRKKSAEEEKPEEPGEEPLPPFPPPR